MASVSRKIIRAARADLVLLLSLAWVFTGSHRLAKHAYSYHMFYGPRTDEDVALMILVGALALYLSYAVLTWLWAGNGS